MKIIKRYKNRRLYDTDLKKYITHNELALYIRTEIPFQVIENATGEDITLKVMSQLLVSELKDCNDLGGTKDILIEAINLGGKKSMSILKNTFLAGVGMFNLTKKKAEEIIDSLIKAGEISDSDRKQAVMELLDKAEESTAKVAEKVKKETSGVQKEIKKLADKVKQMTDKLPQNKIMAELEKLNKKVDNLAKKVNNK